MHKYKSLRSLVVTLALAFMLPGCASFSEHADVNKLLVVAGTMKAIEKGETPEARVHRAESAIAFVEKTRTWLDLEKLTLDELQTRLLAEVYKQQWEPSDKIIAIELINFVIQKLEERVLDGVKLPVPPEEALYQVNTVLDWVESAARIYQ